MTTQSYSKPSFMGCMAKAEAIRCMVECEPDIAVRSTEQVPLLEEGGVDAFFSLKVLSYAPEA